MANTFERMLKDLHREHTRQLAELNAQIALLREEVGRGRDKTSTPSLPSIEAKPTGTTQVTPSSSISQVDSMQSNHGKANDRCCTIEPSSALSFRSKEGSLPLGRWTTPRLSKTTRATMEAVREIYTQATEITESRQPARMSRPGRGSRCSSLKGIVESPGFEAATAAVIIACTLCNAMEAQFDGMKRGYSLEIAGYGYRDDLWVTGVDVLNATDIAFSILFILEFLVRLAVLRCRIFYSLWSWLDLLVVLSSVLDLILGGAHSIKGSKAIRMVRIVKVARLLKALKSGGHFFNVLHVLMASIRSSLSTLCWALLMIIPIQIVCALIMTSILDAFYEREDVTTSKKKAVFLYFGTFSRSLITFFEVLFANYAPACRVLVDNVGEEYGVYIIAYRCICGFSVLCVVQAVFLQQSMKIVSQDSEVMVREKSVSEKKFLKNLQRLFQSLDMTGDGLLTKDEFLETIHNDNVRFCCHALGLDPHDLEDIYHMVDEGAGVTINEFMQSAKHIRKQARTIDMARVLANEQKIRKYLEELPDLVVERMGSFNIGVGQNHVRDTVDASTVTDTQESRAMVSPMPDACRPNKRLSLSL